ncbi:MAG: ABC transporter substrate-binding protein [Methylococcales bacterium]|jgi:microcin C transport system substrate-binding protein|nr:ABC transporter substrate-binding protein [Methylococcales bacterium]MBT7443597.1 ABC transporter substrate-binding protein [Methylococcales bacterium]
MNSDQNKCKPSLVYQLSVLFALSLFAQVCWASLGAALGYEPKYPKDFKHFDYVNPDAPKGGVFKVSAFGSFDNLNPYALKGTSPKGMGLIYESLVEKSLDEPFSVYGLLADKMVLADDGLSVTFHLNPKARFSNGDVVTSEDVKFSFEMITGDGANPFFKYYYTDIKSVEALTASDIKFSFKKKNSELHMVVGDIPIFSKKWVNGRTFKELITVKPVSSGPYIVGSVKLGKEIQYERNPNYWAKDLPVRKGMYNFDKIIVKYYRDQTVILEALKAGEFDFLAEFNSKRWARSHTGPKYDSGELVKTIFKHENNAGMQGFAFNTRRPIFKELAVRKALALAFDFEWANKNLFYNQYTRCDSYFSNTELASTGLPTGDELALLEPFRAQLPESVFTQAWKPSNTQKPSSLRTNLRTAKKLLTEAGWAVKEGVLQKNGVKIEFEVMLSSKAFERVLAPYVKNLKKLGIKVSYRTVDGSLYTRRMKDFDFDMTVVSIGQSLSPGNELYDSFHSKAANTPGSRNYIGVSHPVIDALIDQIVQAKDRQTLITTSRALDRVLLSQEYLVPNWYVDQHRVAMRGNYTQPKTTPLYYAIESWAMQTWWQK